MKMDAFIDVDKFVTRLFGGTGKPVRNIKTRRTLIKASTSFPERPLRDRQSGLTVFFFSCQEERIGLATKIDE